MREGNKYCKYALFAEQGEDKKKVLLPLTRVDVKGEIRGAMVTQNIELTYVNPSEDSPLECTYTFPLDKASTLASLEVTIDDRIIKTKVQDKQEAKEKYEDGIAAGNAAVVAERKKKDEIMTVKLGNLLPGQQAKLKSTILTQLEVVGGYFCYPLDASFFPEYIKLGVKDKDAFNYEFAYQVRILSMHRITNLCLPAYAEIAEQNEARTDLLIRST